MGKSLPGEERRSFVGISEAESETRPATLDEALYSAAEQAVRAGVVTKDGGPVWYDVASLQVEIANQHIRTFKVIVTP